MSIYADTSCVLKLLFPEPETPRVMEIVAVEEHVVVSNLARLETLVQLHARVAGGLLSRSSARAITSRLETLLQHAPYESVRAPAEIVDLAEEYVTRLTRETYCPTLDRLHLAAMQSLGLRRLLTNDSSQARAGRTMGFSVVTPR